MLQIHEGKTCDVIIRHLESRAGKKRSNFVDLAKDHNAPEVMFDIGDQTYVMEHTVVEPFEGHIRLTAEAKIHTQPVIDRLNGTLPLEIFELHIPAKALQGRKMPEIRKIQDALVDWVQATAPTLSIRSYASYIGDRKPVQPPGIPFDVYLYRFEPINSPGFFNIVHLIEEDRDAPRQARISIAIDKKFPKLAQWKQDKKARSILVLEDNDIQLTNQSVVAATYVPLALARPDCPDETYLVFTCTDTWYYWPMLIDGKSYFEMSAEDMFAKEVDSKMLDQITSR